MMRVACGHPVSLCCLCLGLVLFTEAQGRGLGAELETERVGKSRAKLPGILLNDLGLWESVSY
jgi:hypothetical protein